MNYCPRHGDLNENVQNCKKCDAGIAPVDSNSDSDADVAPSETISSPALTVKKKSFFSKDK